MSNNVVFDKNHRLQGFNYSAAGSYMVTFNTAKRNAILSKIVTDTGAPEDAYPALSPIGDIVKEYILEIPAHYQNVFVDAYVIMPDHVHILLTFSAEESATDIASSKLSKIVHALKRMVTNRLGYSIWQLDYYDKIVFSDDKYGALKEYIEDNPKVWLLKRGEPDIRSISSRKSEDTY